MSARTPNLFLIGSMKSGTTYLSELLASHPAIFMCSPKEPCYFTDQRVLRQVWRHMWGRGYWRSIDRYLSLFSQAGDVPIVAEASTPYSQVPLFEGVPQRILAASPEARFIYLMRDPIERTISHYWHAVRWWGERRDLVTAIRREPRYVDVSHYARQLKAYLKCVPRERIHTLTLGELRTQPIERFRAICAWLGIDPSVVPQGLGGRVNEMPAVIAQAKGFGLLHQFKYSPLYRRLEPFVPVPARKLGARLAERAIVAADVDVRGVAAYLRPRMREQTQELCELLGRRFPEWKTLYGLDEAGSRSPSPTCWE
ncbi:MAG TPA: sulfotransferase [Steroidobacteraceae bacterium]|nr:sulfotransferase [Steroidobacteraceae bacterium]